MSQRHDEARQGRPASIGRGGRQAFVSLLVLAVFAWGMVPGGIIELGRKGKKAKGSSTKIFVEGCEYEIVHVAGDPVESIAASMIDLVLAAFNEHFLCCPCPLLTVSFFRMFLFKSEPASVFPGPGATSHSPCIRLSGQTLLQQAI